MAQEEEEKRGETPRRQHQTHTEKTRQRWCIYRPPPPLIMNGRVRPAVLVSIIGVAFPVGSFVKSFAYSSLAPSALSTRINWDSYDCVANRAFPVGP